MSSAQTNSPHSGLVGYALYKKGLRIVVSVNHSLTYFFPIYISETGTMAAGYRNCQLGSKRCGTKYSAFSLRDTRVSSTSRI